jgi:predicted enzyme related to lactoylglutathione lyase
MSNRPTFGFILEYVDDVEAAKPFYVDFLGLEVEREHPTFVQFRDANGVRFAIASDEAMSVSRAPEVYWVVDDVEAAYRDLAPRAAVITPLQQMPFGTLFAIEDPAGQPQYLIEFARSRPSQSVS